MGIISRYTLCITFTQYIISIHPPTFPPFYQVFHTLTIYIGIIKLSEKSIVGKTPELKINGTHGHRNFQFVRWIKVIKCIFMAFRKVYTKMCYKQSTNLGNTYCSKHSYISGERTHPSLLAYSRKILRRFVLESFFQQTNVFTGNSEVKSNLNVILVQL